MKRWVSVLAILSLVVSMASVMTACKKSNTDDGKKTTKTDSAQETVTDVEAATSEDSLRDLLGDWTEEIGEYSTFEHTTNEHYEEDYAALTLPAAVPTTKAAKGSKGSKVAQAAATTQAARRETTTQFQFASYTRGATTTKPGEEKSSDNTTTTAAPVTTAAPETNFSDTTALTERIPESPPVLTDNFDASARPNVTYLDKYVIDVLNSGSYTCEGERKIEGYSFPTTTYCTTDKFAVKATLGSAIAEALKDEGVNVGALLKNAGEIKMVVTGIDTSSPRSYLCVGDGYYEFDESNSDQNTDEAVELLTGGEFNLLLGDIPFDALEYTGINSYTGYAIETYKQAEENLLYRFYFDSQGLAKIEKIDMSTSQVMEVITVKLSSGVKDKNAFKVEGKKKSLDDLQNEIEKYGG